MTTKPMYLNKRISQRAKQTGFTLIELLVVVSILAALAGMTSVAVDTYHRDAQETITHVEMTRISNAIKRFKIDTGYWPRKGPFSYDTTHTETSDSWPANFSINRYRDQYFNDPANFWWLFYQPTKYIGQWKVGTLNDKVRDPDNGATTELWKWDMDSKMGWHGPYLDFPAVKQVIKDQVVSDGCSTMDTATLNASAIRPHSHYPHSITKRMPGLVDRFEQNRATVTGEDYCVIHQLESADFKVVEHSGSPYLYRTDYPENSFCNNSYGCIALQSFGSNGIDESDESGLTEDEIKKIDDIVFILEINKS
ncbi:MAG: type II secretion system protein [Gammaproteobacteria bacterium]|nr:type II secretion system protein [Gammaproteobacteria bacterium]